MPLITCPDCGGQHSDQAPRCAKCGRPNRARQMGPIDGCRPEPEILADRDRAWQAYQEASTPDEQRATWARLQELKSELRPYVERAMGRRP